MASETGGKSVSPSQHSKTRIAADRTGAVEDGARLELRQAYEAVSAKFAPASLLVDEDGNIAHVFAGAEKFLEVGRGVFSARAVDAVLAPLRPAILSLLQRPARSTQSKPHYQVKIKDAEGKGVPVRIHAEKLFSNQQLNSHILIVFTEGTATGGGKNHATSKGSEHVRVGELEYNLQSTVEQLATSNEELQTTNEELMSANEELQSTNEELHAVNEELYSVSAEHQRKIDELIALNNDIDNLFQCIDVGTIFLDAGNRIRRFTPAATAAFHLLDRDVGRPISHVKTRFPAPWLLTDIEAVSQSRQQIEHSVSIEGRNFLLRIFPFETAGAVDGVILTLVDVSRIVQAERVVETRNQELARANASLEQFTYIVSHDLRAPLRTIQNSAKWIIEDLRGTASSEIAEHCDRLSRYVSRLEDMLSGLLKYAHLSGDTAKPVETADLQDLLHKIAETLDSDGRLDLRLDFEPIAFMGTIAPLQLVFQNLIDNALKYCGQPKAVVTIGAEDLGDVWNFSVSDNGPGIPERHHEKVFLPFRKLEPASDKPGTGMGLALVQKAIRDNGGEIELISSPETRRGTTFRFTWAKAASTAKD